MVRWIKRLALGAFALVVLALGSGALYQALGSRAYLRNHPPPGVMVDLGTHELHLLCQGSGTPTVVFDSGLGDGLLSWSTVQPEIARTTRACSYDRAGHGWSDAGPLPRTSGRIVDELFRLLETADVQPPLVLVGHSFGGPNVRLFARRHPGMVAGLVTVDGSHEDQTEVLPPSPAAVDTMIKLLPWLGRFGVTRLLAGRLAPPVPVLSDEVNSNRTGQLLLTRNLVATASEAASWDISMDQVRSAPALPPDLPLIALAATKMEIPWLSAEEQAAAVETWHRLQREIVARSSRGELRIIDGASHYIQFDDPVAVIDAVVDVVHAVRSTDGS